MKVILCLGFILLVSCTKESEKKNSGFRNFREITIIADTIGDGKLIKMDDQIRLHFRVTLLRKQKKIGQNTYAKGTPALVTLGAGHIPKYFERQLIGMKVGGRRSIFFPKDSLKRRPPIQLDIFVLEVVEPIRMWKLGKFTYKKTISGLKYHIIEEGDGGKLKIGDSIKVHYTGFLKNGKKFDSSVERGIPLDICIAKTSLIKGWTEALLLLNRGSKVRIKIPPDLGYGDKDKYTIPANSTLIFDLVVLKEEK